jgi:hypothetical protein
MAASLAAKRASSPLVSPTAKVNVSEFLSQTRPPHTVATVKSNVSAANRTTCLRLLLRSGRRERRVSDDGVGTSALMAHIRNSKGAEIAPMLS